MTPLAARIGHDFGDFADLLVRRAAQGTEARRAETLKDGSVHDGPVAKPCAHNPSPQS